MSPTTPPCKPEAANLCPSSPRPLRFRFTLFAVLGGRGRVPLPSSAEVAEVLCFRDLRRDERVVHAVERARRLGTRFRLQPRGRPAVVLLGGGGTGRSGTAGR